MVFNLAKELQILSFLKMMNTFGVRALTFSFTSHTWLSVAVAALLDFFFFLIILILSSLTRDEQQETEKCI